MSGHRRWRQGLYTDRPFLLFYHGGSSVALLGFNFEYIRDDYGQVNDAYVLHKVSESPLKPRDLSIALEVDLVALVGVHGSFSFGSLFSGFDLLVQSDQNLSEPEAASDSHCEHCDHDSVRFSEAVFGHLPHVRSSDVAELREGVDHGDRDRSLRRRPWEAAANHRVERNESCVRAGLKEERDVSSGDNFSRDRYDKSYEPETDGTDNVPELKVSTR